MSDFGSNVTDMTGLDTGLGLERLELLHELIPDAKTIGALVYPTLESADRIAADFDSAACTLGLDELHLLSVGTERELDEAFATLAEFRIRALVVGASAFFSTRARRLAALSNRHAIPAIFHSREFTLAGGLMSYGGSDPNAERPAATYADRTIEGERLEYSPVERTGKVELVINLRTAKALGITFPLTLLGRADEVIE
jgi:ABC-type uncharacterized transport system substrate-binding protein